LESKNVVIVFIKNPELGKVKTRLAKTVGDEKALKIYKSLMSHTKNVVQSVEASRLLFYSEWIHTSDEWSPDFFNKQLQPKGDLGNRMTAAFEQGFKKGSPVVIVGSDCPGLSTEIINQAFSLLKANDFVIGPALDGGYYLMGMNSFNPEVFQNIEWSTETVKQKTIEKISALEKTYKELEPLSDIDFEEDWIKYGWELDSE